MLNIGFDGFIKFSFMRGMDIIDFMGRVRNGGNREGWKYLRYMF